MMRFDLVATYAHNYFQVFPKILLDSSAELFPEIAFFPSVSEISF